MWAARVFLRASAFKVRTCSVVQARRVETFLGIKQLPVLKEWLLCSWKFPRQPATSAKPSANFTISFLGEEILAFLIERSLDEARGHQFVAINRTKRGDN
jgi:hypothetical protein